MSGHNASRTPPLADLDEPHRTTRALGRILSYLVLDDGIMSQREIVSRCREIGNEYLACYVREGRTLDDLVEPILGMPFGPPEAEPPDRYEDTPYPPPAIPRPGEDI